MASIFQKWWLPFFLLILISAPFMIDSAAEADHPKSHVAVKLSDPSVKCDTCEVPQPPPPPPACPPPPPPPCPPPPPSCVPCSETPEVYLPPPPALGYLMSGAGNVYVTTPYGSDIYSGQTRSSVADITSLLGLWALLIWV